MEFLVPLSLLWPPVLISLPTLISLLLISAGLGLAIWSVRAFDAAGTPVEPTRPTLHIVTRGPYRFSRNPIYLGFLLVFAGLCLGFSLEWGFLALPLLWLTLDRVVVLREEAYLTRKFGDQYTAYLRATRRWI